MTRRISFINFKGGVGKTSLTVNIAAFLTQEFGQRVLLVDCDAQSNASFWLLGAARWNEINEKPQKSIYTVFMNRDAAPPLHQNIVKSVLVGEKGELLLPTLDLLPASYELMELEELQPNPNKPFYLKFYEDLSAVFGYYDYVLFDCPPNVFRACQCAIFASEEVYVPCNPDELSYAGLSLLARKIDEFNQKSILAQSLIQNYRRPMINGIILNSVLTTGDFTDVILKIKNRIHQMRISRAVSPSVEILSQRIRHTIKVGKTVGDHLPIALSGQRRDAIYEDYLNLTRFIHKSPLY